MPTVQGNVLVNSKFKLGKEPIFIFSENEVDGLYMSLLLSNHLDTTEFIGNNPKPISVLDNYFLNPSIYSLLESSKNEQEFLASLDLIIEEGFDTLKLLGVSLPIQQLTSNLTTHFQNSLFIIVYDEYAIETSELIRTRKQYLSSVQNNPASFIISGSHRLRSFPTSLLTIVNTHTNTGIKSLITIRPHSELKTDKVLKLIQQKVENESLKECRQAEVHQKFETLLIKDSFICLTQISYKQQQEVQKFIAQIYQIDYRIQPITLITQSKEDLIDFQTLFDQLNLTANVQAYYYEPNVYVEKLNQLILKNNAEYILIDPLLDVYDKFDMFKPYSNNISFRYSKIEQSNKISTSDLPGLLSTDQIETAIICKKTDFIDVIGLDHTLSNEYIAWDLGIRILQHTQLKAEIIQSSIIAYDRFEPPTKNNIAYNKVVLKHTNLIESSLQSIITIIHEEKFYSQQTSNKLHSKIASLQVMLQHSKDELKSLNELTGQLQQRIQGLESSFYFRLKTKLVRIKKIFFKKKSPGSGTLKRILLFIRFSLSKAGFSILRKIIKGILKKMYLMAENRPVQIKYLDEEQTSTGIHSYHDWIRNKLNADDLQQDYDEHIYQITFKPTISIIIPVYNPPIKFLKECIESVLNQQYENWELCLADDNSPEPKVKKLLHAYSVKDKRIKVNYRKENGHISAASNSALELATGEYILFMDHDDLITRNCLWEVIKCLNKNHNAEIIYSDEDKINEAGIHQQAHFKPSWSPDNLLSRNYMGHVVIIKKIIVDQIGGFRLGFEGSQDYDLLLRATEVSNSIIHIPKVLYHWRIHALSAAQGEDVKPYAYIAAKKALESALERRNLRGDIKYLSGLRGYKINYQLQPSGKVSIIIPSKDQKELLKNTIDSILEKTDYKNFEIIILNNNSTSEEFYDFIKLYTHKHANLIQCIEAHFPFNFAKLMNIGVRASKGEFILFLNNDVEIIHADWLSTMVNYAQQKRIGAVGVKLLYPDDTIQHAGVIVGLGGIAGHSFVGAYKDEPGYFNYIQSVNNYSAVTAACLLCRKEVFNEVGGMDETFEVEYNDVDFCLQLIEAGYYNVYLPQVELYHYESATRGHPHQSKVSYERHLKEMKLFKDKWQKYIDHDPCYNPNLNIGVHDFSMNFDA